MRFIWRGYSLPLLSPSTLFFRRSPLVRQLSGGAGGLWLKSKNPVWRSLYHFWSKIFAVNFGMGVVSGLVMAYQFGTNWSGFSQFAGSITGPLLTYEVLTAFFLEAGFLGVMLFGWNKVGPGLHFFATCMVALGTLISTFWILASNSWMQTPQGLRSSTAVVPVDWFAVVFNPPFRIACCICPLPRFSAVRCLSLHLPHGTCCAEITPCHSPYVLNGAVDDADCRPYPGIGWGHAWPQHPQASTG